MQAYKHGGFFFDEHLRPRRRELEIGSHSHLRGNVCIFGTGKRNGQRHQILFEPPLELPSLELPLPAVIVPVAVPFVLSMVRSICT
jgi:hypothetical protein